jgi:hypothetical protein
MTDHEFNDAELFRTSANDLNTDVHAFETSVIVREWSSSFDGCC